jgi:hypothetical protein
LSTLAELRCGNLSSSLCLVDRARCRCVPPPIQRSLRHPSDLIRFISMRRSSTACAITEGFGWCRTIFQTACIALLLLGAASAAPAQIDAAAKKSANASEGPGRQAGGPKVAKQAQPGARPAKPPLRRRTAANPEATSARAAHPVVSLASRNGRWNARSTLWGKPSSELSFGRAPGCLVPYRIVSPCLTNLPPMQAALWW